MSQLDAGIVVWKMSGRRRQVKNVITSSLSEENSLPDFLSWEISAHSRHRRRISHFCLQYLHKPVVLATQFFLHPPSWIAKKPLAMLWFCFHKVLCFSRIEILLVAINKMLKEHVKNKWCGLAGLGRAHTRVFNCDKNVFQFTVSLLAY